MRFIGKIILTTLLFFSKNGYFSQNLVRNYSFEDTLPRYYFNAKNWYERGTVNYYWYGNLDGIRNSKVIETKALTGECFVGLYLNQKIPVLGRETLIGEIRSPLEKDAIYEIRFFVKFSKRYRYKINKIEVEFFNKERNYESVEVPLCSKKDTLGWYSFSEKYKANGGEEMFRLGCFQPYINYKRNGFSKKRREPAAFIYVDDVSIVKVLSQENKDNIDTTIVVPTINEDTSRISKKISYNVYFDVDQSLIDSSYKDTLNLIADYLANNTSSKLYIFGYADISGNEDHNLNLSMDRAKQVALYFISKNINKNRIFAYGKGVNCNSTKYSECRKAEIVIID